MCFTSGIIHLSLVPFSITLVWPLFLCSAGDVLPSFRVPKLRATRRDSGKEIIANPHAAPTAAMHVQLPPAGSDEHNRSTSTLGGTSPTAAAGGESCLRHSLLCLQDSHLCSVLSVALVTVLRSRRHCFGMGRHRPP